MPELTTEQMKKAERLYKEHLKTFHGRLDNIDEKHQRIANSSYIKWERLRNVWNPSWNISKNPPYERREYRCLEWFIEAEKNPYLLCDIRHLKRYIYDETPNPLYYEPVLREERLKKGVCYIQL